MENEKITRTEPGHLRLSALHMRHPNNGFATYFIFAKTGAGGGNRTPDIQLGKLTFYR